MTWETFILQHNQCKFHANQAKNILLTRWFSTCQWCLFKKAEIFRCYGIRKFRVIMCHIWTWNKSLATHSSAWDIYFSATRWWNYTPAYCKSNETFTCSKWHQFVYLNLIQSIEKIDDDGINKYQIWSIQQKSQYIALSLYFAKEHRNKWKWETCCKTALGQLKLAGKNHTMNACTIM